MESYWHLSDGRDHGLTLDDRWLSGQMGKRFCEECGSRQKSTQANARVSLGGKLHSFAMGCFPFVQLGYVTESFLAIMDQENRSRFAFGNILIGDGDDVIDDVYTFVTRKDKPVHLLGGKNELLSECDKCGNTLSNSFFPRTYFISNHPLVGDFIETSLGGLLVSDSCYQRIKTRIPKTVDREKIIRQPVPTKDCLSRRYAV